MLFRGALLALSVGFKQWSLETEGRTHSCVEYVAHHDRFVAQPVPGPSQQTGAVQDEAGKTYMNHDPGWRCD